MMTTAALWMADVTICVMSCFVCAVSVRTRERICPALYSVKKPSGSRWMRASRGRSVVAAGAIGMRSQASPAGPAR